MLTLLTKTETARALRTSTRNLDRWVARGLLAPLKVGRRRLFDAADVERFARARRVEQPDQPDYEAAMRPRPAS